MTRSSRGCTIVVSLLLVAAPLRGGIGRAPGLRAPDELCSLASAAPLLYAAAALPLSPLAGTGLVHLLGALAALATTAAAEPAAEPQRPARPRLSVAEYEGRWG